MGETDPRLRVAEAAMQVFPRRVLADGPGWVVDRSRPGVWAMSTPYPVAFLNAAGWARLDEVDDVDALVEEVVADFVERGLPWHWATTPGSTSPALEEALRRAGLVPSGDPIMHLALPTDLPSPGEHDVVVVNRVPAEALEAVVDGFGGPPSMLEVMASLEDHLGTDTALAAYVEEGGRVLGAGQAFPDDGRMMVANVAVREEARGRGVGTAVTAALLAAGQERGVTDAVLTSSPLGHGVYRALGFVDVGTRTSWTWTPPDDAESADPVH